MHIQRINFPQIIPDNEVSYMRYLEGVLSSVDPDSSMMLSRCTDKISTRISPSLPMYFNILLEETKKFHNMLGIKVEFSKSMKAGANIHFIINFDSDK